MPGFAMRFAVTNSAPNPGGCGPNLVEAVGIDTAGQRRNVNADRSRSELSCVHARLKKNPGWGGGTSEELRSPVSPCAAG